MKHEELKDVELEEEETGDEGLENVEETKKAKTEKIELDYSMNAVDRLRAEIDFTNSEYQKVVGEFLLKEFAKDENLKMMYFTKKITLKDIWESIVKVAKKKATNGAAVMSDEEVLGLAIHYITDGEIKETKSSKVTLTREEKKSLEEQAKAEYLAEQKKKLKEQERKKKEREENARKKALEKEKEEREKFGTISLFDDWEG